MRNQQLFSKRLCVAVLSAALLTLTAAHPAVAQARWANALSSDEPHRSAPRSQPDVQAQVDAWLERLSPAERVGQLFVVAFSGSNPSPASKAGQLIQEYKVGGVVLLSGNHNLVNTGPDTPAQVAVLANKLQSMAMGWDLRYSDGLSLPTESDGSGPGIPLFVALDHEGDGFPYTRITAGVTPLPNPMAIGATWDAQYAEQVGEIVGRELAAMGVNMLLGPVVDVLSAPRPGAKGDAGTRVFGGDPYWVSEMGRAYVRGVHAGSGERVLTVAKHFPGHGGSDRLPDDEVATVDKSLQELQRVELVPFFAVTQDDADGLSRTDAMMSSHIRYRGFYGDIRQFTRPISFDAEIMQAVLSLEPFRSWQETGVMVSDSLGVPAVRKYFDPQLGTFPHRQIARQAFLAGNDLLILSQFALTSDWTQHYRNVSEVIEYFVEQVQSDPAFAARVDDAVRRILRLKLSIYSPEGELEGSPSFSPEEVLISPDELEGLGAGTAVIDQIARAAATVLHPTEDSLPRPPRPNEDILILAEERMVRECFETLPECDPRPLVSPSALEQTILRIYGPEGTGQVSPDRIHTRTFAQLKALLNLPTASGTPPAESTAGLEPLLEEAEWILFTMLDPNPTYANSDALELYLARNAQQIYDANVVVLAYTAPYYLDATDISKLTAYYVFYSKTDPFIEASARTLFGEVTPRGRSPVSIEGTYYDLGTQLSPDPEQEIVLDRISPTTGSALAPVVLRVRTHTILDRNGNQVPDGTQVRFVARDAVTEQILDSISSPTEGGMAEAALSIGRAGQVMVVASSGEGSAGRPLAFQALAEPTPTALPPTPTPTASAAPEPTPTATRKLDVSPVPSPTPPLTPTPTVETPSDPIWTMAITSWQARPLDLIGLVGGYALVLIPALGAPMIRSRGKRQQARAGWLRTVLICWVGALLGLMVYGWGWLPLDRWLRGPSWMQGGLLAAAGAAVLALLDRWRKRGAAGR